MSKSREEEGRKNLGSKESESPGRSDPPRWPVWSQEAWKKGTLRVTKHSEGNREYGEP